MPAPLRLPPLSDLGLHERQGVAAELFFAFEHPPPDLRRGGQLRQGEAERFSKLLAAYERSPGVTRQRLYYETIEGVLGSTNKVLVDTEGTGNMLYVPLDKLTERRVPTLTLDEQRQSSGAAARETQESADVSIEARRERGSR